jgi:hypothetical protein
MSSVIEVFSAIMELIISIIGGTICVIFYTYLVLDGGFKYRLTSRINTKIFVALVVITLTALWLIGMHINYSDIELSNYIHKEMDEFMQFSGLFVSIYAGLVSLCVIINREFIENTILNTLTLFGFASTTILLRMEPMAINIPEITIYIPKTIIEGVIAITILCVLLIVTNYVRIKMRVSNQHAIQSTYITFILILIKCLGLCLNPLIGWNNIYILGGLWLFSTGIILTM